MRVGEIEIQDGQRRAVVIDEDGRLVEPIVRYLKYLDCVGSARQTLRSYAYSLKHYWEYLTQQHLNWQQVTLDDLSRFVLWLKLPSGSLKVLPAHPVEQARSNRTINHTLTVVRSFYDYHWRMEEVSTNLKDKTTTSLPGRFRRYIGESLALFVEDIDVAENRIHIRDRGELENGAEIKTIHASRALDVSSDLIDEVVAYVGRVHTAEVETNHLFIKLHGQRSGQALTYADVDSLFRRLRQKTGRQHVTPHVLRHTMLTTLAELGWQPELLQERAGHASFQQTYQIYVHPSQEALRAAWVQTQDQVCLTSSPQGY